jgi:S1-C subfamily serine protease
VTRDPYYDAPPPIVVRPQAPPGPPARFVVLSILFAALLVYVMWKQFGPAPTQSVVTPRGELAADEKSTITLFQQASPSVVYITRLNRAVDNFRNVVEVPSGTGSGFIWDDQGHVVTNFHVIQGANFAKVTLSDHGTYDASLVGVAPEFDIAVLKIDAPRTKLQPILIGTSGDLQVGQRVFAIGNPFGLDQTLTTGIVSALGRTIQSLTRQPIGDVIQTDAAINPGNSGGPLLDSAGRLIGVNTAIYSPSGSSAGIGFAVPVDLVRRTVDQIVAQGRVVRPQLGVAGSNRMGRLVLDRLGLKSGMPILNVEPGSGSDDAGVKPFVILPGGQLRGDVLLSIDNRPVNSTEDLYTVLQRYGVGDTVTLKILRDKQEIEVPVKLKPQRELQQE